jgi:hypothetical protein
MQVDTRFKACVEAVKLSSFQAYSFQAFKLSSFKMSLRKVFYPCRKRQQYIFLSDAGVESNIRHLLLWMRLLWLTHSLLSQMLVRLLKV